MNYLYYVVIVLTYTALWIFYHELGHMIVAILLGYKPILSVGRAYLMPAMFVRISMDDIPVLHYGWVSFGGLLGMVSAILIYLGTNNILLLSVLFCFSGLYYFWEMAVPFGGVIKYIKFGLTSKTELEGE